MKRVDALASRKSTAKATSVPRPDATRPLHNEDGIWHTESMLSSRVPTGALFVIATFACASVPRAAQNTEFVGTTLDPSSQEPLAGALVSVNVSTPFSNSPECYLTRSDSSGHFRFAAIPEGEYEIIAEKDGYDAAWVQHFRATAPSSSLQLPLPKLESFAALLPVWQRESTSNSQTRIEMPRKLSGPDPSPTPESIEHGVHGQMFIRCVMTIAGRLERCSVIKGLPYLDRPVVRALEARRYSPAVRQGEAVEIEYALKLYFGPMKWDTTYCRVE